MAPFVGLRAPLLFGVEFGRPVRTAVHLLIGPAHRVCRPATSRNFPISASVDSRTRMGGAIESTNLNIPDRRHVGMQEILNRRLGMPIQDSLLVYVRKRSLILNGGSRARVLATSKLRSSSRRPPSPYAKWVQAMSSKSPIPQIGKTSHISPSRGLLSKSRYFLRLRCDAPISDKNGIYKM